MTRPETRPEELYSWSPGLMTSSGIPQSPLQSNEWSSSPCASMHAVIHRIDLLNTRDGIPEHPMHRMTIPVYLTHRHLIHHEDTACSACDPWCADDVIYVEYYCLWSPALVVYIEVPRCWATNGKPWPEQDHHLMMTTTSQTKRGIQDMPSRHSRVSDLGSVALGCL